MAPTRPRNIVTQASNRQVPYQSSGQDRDNARAARRRRSPSPSFSLDGHASSSGLTDDDPSVAGDDEDNHSNTEQAAPATSTSRGWARRRLPSRRVQPPEPSDSDDYDSDSESNEANFGEERSPSPALVPAAGANIVEPEAHVAYFEEVANSSTPSVSFAVAPTDDDARSSVPDVDDASSYWAESTAAARPVVEEEDYAPSVPQHRRILPLRSVLKPKRLNLRYKLRSRGAAAPAPVEPVGPAPKVSIGALPPSLKRKRDEEEQERIRTNGNPMPTYWFMVPEKIKDNAELTAFYKKRALPLKRVWQQKKPLWIQSAAGVRGHFDKIVARHQLVNERNAPARKKRMTLKRWNEMAAKKEDKMCAADLARDEIIVEYERVVLDETNVDLASVRARVVDTACFAPPTKFVRSVYPTFDSPAWGEDFGHAEMEAIEHSSAWTMEFPKELVPEAMDWNDAESDFPLFAFESSNLLFRSGERVRLFSLLRVSCPSLGSFFVVQVPRSRRSSPPFIGHQLWSVKDYAITFEMHAELPLNLDRFVYRVGRISILSPKTRSIHHCVSAYPCLSARDFAS